MERNIFLKLYFDDEIDDDIKKEQMIIKNDNIPEFLYNSHSTKHLDDILQNQFMLLPKIKGLNAPYEGNILYNIAIYTYNELENILEMLKKNGLPNNYNKKIKKTDIDELQKDIFQKYESLKGEN